MGTFDDPNLKDVETIAYEAQMARAAGNEQEASEKFAEASRRMFVFVESIPPEKDRVRGVLAVEAVALAQHADRADEVQRMALHFLTADPALHREAVLRLREILREHRLKRTGSPKQYAQLEKLRLAFRDQNFPRDLPTEAAA